jgi:hypothetical protein
MSYVKLINSSNEAEVMNTNNEYMYKHTYLITFAGSLISGVLSNGSISIKATGGSVFDDDGEGTDDLDDDEEEEDADDDSGVELGNGSIPIKATGGFVFDDDGDETDDFDDDEEEGEDGEDIAVLFESDLISAFVVDVDVVVGFVTDAEIEGVDPAAPVFMVDDLEGVFVSLSITVVAVVGRNESLISGVSNGSIPMKATGGLVFDDDGEGADDLGGVFVSLSIIVSEFADTFVVSVVGIVVDMETASSTAGDFVVDDFDGTFKSLSITISPNSLFLDSLSL